MTRYPQLDLAAFIGRLSGRAEARKVSRFNTLSWRLAESEGLSVEQADRLAGRLGCHPSELWPQWPALNMQEIERPCEDCGIGFVPVVHRGREQRFCGHACRQRAWARSRYAVDPSFAERKRQSARSYYAENGSYVRAAERRRYHERKASAA